MDKAFIAQGIANKVNTAENAIDAALRETAVLMSGIAEARQELRVSATVDEKAVAKVAEAMTALAQARQAIVLAHHELSEVKLRVGIRTKLTVWPKDNPLALEHGLEQRQVG